MPKVGYMTKKFRSGSLALIEKINGVIADYQRRGFSLTLRQVYYQMVARDIIPNSERSYKMLSSLISDARLAVLVDWFAIEELTRNFRRNFNRPLPVGSPVQRAQFMLWLGGEKHTDIVKIQHCGREAVWQSVTQIQKKLKKRFFQPLQTASNCPINI